MNQLTFREDEYHENMETDFYPRNSISFGAIQTNSLRPQTYNYKTPLFSRRVKNITYLPNSTQLRREVEKQSSQRDKLHKAFL